MASNNVYLRKIENFVSCKCYPEEYRKINKKKVISENIVRTLKSLMGTLHIKGKKGDIWQWFDL